MHVEWFIWSHQIEPVPLGRIIPFLGFGVMTGPVYEQYYGVSSFRIGKVCPRDHLVAFSDNFLSTIRQGQSGFLDLA